MKNIVLAAIVAFAALFAVAAPASAGGTSYKGHTFNAYCDGGVKNVTVVRNGSGRCPIYFDQREINWLGNQAVGTKTFVFAWKGDEGLCMIPAEVTKRDTKVRPWNKTCGASAERKFAAVGAANRF